MIADETDQIFAVASNGVVIRTSVSDVRATGRDTMGVSLMNLGEGDTLVGIARAAEKDEDDDEATEVAEVTATVTTEAGPEAPVEASEAAAEPTEE